MHPIYNLAKMVCSLILIIMMFRLVMDLGETYVEYFSRANSRVIQEFVSGFISISNFAPSKFYVNNTFPEVSHILKILEDPPLVNISSGKTSKQPKIIFKEYQPLGYTKLDGIKLGGKCIKNWCEFSGEKLNTITIIKEKGDVEISHNIVETKR
ncbi:MAG: hypothetical protein KQA36_02160 [Candidatus Aenigmarchaeota archaeon]|nr:hypothetical protein [Candidatus Aenigmarchaeota archaeon]